MTMSCQPAFIFIFLCIHLVCVKEEKNERKKERITERKKKKERKKERTQRSEIKNAKKYLLLGTRPENYQRYYRV